ncbi:3-hydroxyacyl-CoA dehydrogenase [Carbonactinospora thermoautotrophica]|uniref:3-hydroxyacyl-CoA dehydrogenase NAD-binding domain-containing protein n=1 Tax=Carbonactinospora thermoautotrophica TaxID=1469144 RepID=UPI00226F99EF|nr:3-hydroxyacyl-CoA dehydrogenase NAD-binding domain-containing protein [Carbonactinospora thermoautotrophica]MCX9190706.1 3-hydroxyacyl-CoA dehydrogenase [Carbonactinospora thermoautotrophica]
MSNTSTQRPADEVHNPDEVVTRALVQYVDLPLGAGRFALITLDNGHDHTKPNTFGPGGLTSLDAALDQVEQENVVGVGITGKPFIFCVGADLTGVPKITSREQALQIGRLGHQVFRRLGEFKVPTFAFVNGAALGGGLEVALHCTYRTVSSGVTALALPECFLGLVPGWGGTYLLPNLIGADAAVTVIIENPLNQNKMINGRTAYELGIADAIFEPADFLERSLYWAAEVLTDKTTVQRRAVDRGEAWDNALARGKAIADQKLHGAAPAPYRALDLIKLARTASRDEAFAAEDEALADLVMSEELRAGLYSFELVQKRAKRPVGAPDKSLARPVTKVGIVGAGLMASQLALLFARRLEVPVVMTDLDQERIDKGIAYVHGELDKLVAKGRLSQDKANRYKANVTGSLDKSAFADAEFVIEAVFEEMKVKQAVFAEVEAVVSAECVLATNTSSLSVTEMASKLEHPERVVGFHFFNPVAVLPLLEVVKAEKTDDPTLATAFAVGKQLKKSCVLVKDRPAFVVNRILTRFLSEIVKCVDEGTPFEVADSSVEPLGLPMSPFVLLQLVGPAVALHVAEYMHAQFPDRFHVSENMRKVVELGKPGIWAWDEKGRPYLDPEVAAVVQQGDSPSTAEQVRERALAALAEEIRIMLEEGVVAEPQDIDLCMILGAGWPFHLGGITPYLDRTGISEKVNGKRFLPKGVASLPA